MYLYFEQNKFPPKKITEYRGERRWHSRKKEFIYPRNKIARFFTEKKEIIWRDDTMRKNRSKYSVNRDRGWSARI